MAAISPRSAAASPLDALYAAIYAALLPEVPGPTQVVVDVDPTWPAGQLAQPHPPAATWRSPPAATLLPLHLTSEDVLLQSIFFALFEHVAAEAVTRNTLPEHWLPVRNGLATLAALANGPAPGALAHARVALDILGTYITHPARQQICPVLCRPIVRGPSNLDGYTR